MSSRLITPGFQSPDALSNVQSSAVSNWTTVSDASTTWNDVAWSPELNLFARVRSAGGSQYIETSSDGISWTPYTPDKAYQGITWSRELGIFLGVGTNVVVTSSTGTTWTSVTETGDWNDVAWSSELGLFFVVGNGEYATSPDGVTFTTTSATGNWIDVAWSPSLKLFLTVGSAIRASFDGSTFTTASETGPWNAVAWSPELSEFLIVGTNVRATSTGGTSAFTTASETGTWNSVAWAPQLSLFQVVGNDRRATFDGTTFTSVSETGVWNAIAWAPELSRFSVAGTNFFMYNVPSFSSYVQTASYGTQGVTDVTVSGQDVSIGPTSNNVTIGKYASSVTIGGPGVPVSIGGTFMGVSYMKDQRGKGANGGRNSANVWNTRFLNTITTYGDIDCVLSSVNFDIANPANTDAYFTLAPGTYMVHASAPGYVINANQIRLRNTTAGITLATGSGAYANVTVNTLSVIDGAIFTLSASSQLEIQHISQTDSGSQNAFGVSIDQALSNSEFSIYTQVFVYRLF